MMTFRHILQTTPLPPALLDAAIEFVADDRPDLRGSRTPLADLALALGYDRLTAAVLVARVNATARLFANPGWAAFSRYRRTLPLEQAIAFQGIVLRFVAAEPLDSDLTFEPRRLFALLLDRLACRGNA